MGNKNISKFRVGLPSQPVPYSPLGSRQQLGVNRLDTMTTWVAAPAHMEHTKTAKRTLLGHDTQEQQQASKGSINPNQNNSNNPNLL